MNERRAMQKDLLIITESDFRLLRMYERHDELQHELERAIVVSSEAVPKDVVTMHSRVLYLDETTGERRLVRIVYPVEADASAGRISVLAPVGAALLGLSVGQAIEWDFPDGSRRRLRVEDVSYQPESARRLAALGL
jgi:regulator of nucleoside diphosphate kinase